MKVKCVANTGRALSQTSFDAGDLITSEFPVDIGYIYTVYGMSIWRGRVDYLVDIAGNPQQRMSHAGWYNAELFEVVDDRLPPNWHFNFRGFGVSFLHAIWGYPELMDENHCVGLIELNMEDMLIFLKRKKEIDEFSQ
ncbi:MAG: phosphoribosylaminoimidazole synthetase [Armatimonadota bacterium]